VTVEGAADYRFRELGPHLGVNSRERELLTGMGNCFDACHADFEETIGMVADTRHRTRDDVKEELRRLRMQYGDDPEYHRLRSRFPTDFPI
jgi:hypothetical protein